MYMILLVMDDLSQIDSIINAWEQIGIRGVTMIESTGLGRVRDSRVLLRYYFQETRLEEEGHMTLLVVVPDLEQVQACLQATESVTGDLSGPNTGIFTAWPLAVVKGITTKAE
jgi:nitrogen regulatory protein PII